MVDRGAAAAARRTGRTRWRRFAAVCLPALVVAAVMVVATAQGVLAVSFAGGGQQRLKIHAEQFQGKVTAAFPQFYETGDGQRHVVAVVTIRDIRARGLCLSTTADTPVGQVVVRAVTRPDGPVARAGTLRFAIESIDGAGLESLQVALNRLRTAPDEVPVDVDPSGSIPVQARKLGIMINATVRWATIDSVNLSGLDLTMGSDVAECF